MKSITEKLENLTDNERTGHQGFSGYSLEHIRRLLRYYGNPHKKIKTVHIAGTNGKGSTAAMLSGILIAAGYRTGLYTSPHLVRVNERIKVNNREIPNEKLNFYTGELIELLNNRKDLRPTYFDALTLFAFRYFSESGADIAVIEVGLGGRLDSTNLIRPLVSIITDISIDHKNVLGNTILKIAFEKAGIIKKRTPAITVNTKKNILGVLSKEASLRSSGLLVFNKDFRIENMKFNKENRAAFDIIISNPALPLRLVENIKLRQPGYFQMRNAASAVAATAVLCRKGFNITGDHIRKALKNLTVPGRLQVLSKNPLVIFDPAHNAQAFSTTISALKAEYPGRDYRLVVSFMIDKEYKMMIKTCKRELTDRIYYFELDDKRCWKISGEKPGKNSMIFKGIKSYNDIDDLSRALRGDLYDKSLVFVTGSFRLFGIAKILALKLKRKS